MMGMICFLQFGQFQNALSFSKFVSFSLDSFKMRFHFQNMFPVVWTVSKCAFIFKICFFQFGQFQNALSFSKSVHFQNLFPLVWTVSKCAFIFKMLGWRQFFQSFCRSKITKPLFYSMNMLPNWLPFLPLDGRSYKLMHSVK